MTYLCHLICVFVCMCVCVCVKGAGGVERLWPRSLLLIGNPLSSCPQGHFLLLAHLPGNPLVTPWPSMSASRQIRGFPWKQRALLRSLPPSTPATLLLIQTLYPSLPCPEAITNTHAHAQTSNCKHWRRLQKCVVPVSLTYRRKPGHILEPGDSTVRAQPDATC